MREPVYISHTCHNWKRKPSDTDYCDRAFHDLDLKNSRSRSPDWKYCPQCVAKGFVNPDKPPKRKNLVERGQKLNPRSKHNNDSVIVD